MKIQGHDPARFPGTENPLQKKRVFLFLVAETMLADYITINITGTSNVLKFIENKTAFLTTNQTGGL